MGGNAFNHIGYTAERMSKEEFHTIEREIFTVLHELNIYGLSIPYVKEKESFGDIDIVIVKEDDRNVKEIICDNIEKFGLREELIFRNKDVISILYKEKYQIDFIFTNRKEKDYHQAYLAYNDLGNLLGRIIKESGFQHGHNGLFYVYREGNHYKELIELTTDYADALDILGLDVEKFYSGFDTFTEMFEYVTHIPRFQSFSLKSIKFYYTQSLCHLRA
jgi:DNA polymerase/3'-5' exonuclease PolX